MASKKFEDFYGDLENSDDRKGPTAETSSTGNKLEEDITSGSSKVNRSKEIPDSQDKPKDGTADERKESTKPQESFKSNIFRRQRDRSVDTNASGKDDTLLKGVFGPGCGFGKKNVADKGSNMFTKAKTTEKKEISGSQPIKSSAFMFEYHTEYSGVPGPHDYRYPHIYANTMELVSPLTTEATKVKRVESDTLSAPTNVCGYCKRQADDGDILKRCSRCLAVSYCGKECQRSHFINHKLFCKRCDRYDIARARVWPALRFYRDLRHDRDFVVLMTDLPSEIEHHMGVWCNLLVEIVGRLEHMYRYSVLVTDLAGQKMRLNFHDPSHIYPHPVHGFPIPLPVSLEKCLKPGQFLLVMGTHWRRFADGEIGIRFNDLESVYHIQMDDFEVPKEYRK